MSSTYTITIAGQAQNVEAGTVDVTNEIGQRSQATFTCWTTTGVHWGYGTPLTITSDTGARIYSGFVETDQASKPGWAPLLEHAITGMDNHYLADKRLAFQSYLNATAGSIVTSLWQNYLQPEGVTLGPIAAGLTIPEKVWNGDQVSAALDWLAQQCGYWWQIDENRVLWFQPYGGTVAPFALDGTQVSQDDKLSVTYGNRQYRNRQFLVGGKDKTGVLTETFIGDGHKQAFTLRYGVAEITGKDTASGQVKGIYVNGVAQTLANKSQNTGAQWYYATADAVLAQDSSQPILGPSDVLTVIYKGEYPVVALAQNATLITQQRTLEAIGTGYVEVKDSNNKVHSLQAGFQIAQAELAHYGQGMTTLVWQMPASRGAGLAQGQLLDVDLPDFALDEQMLVRSVEYTDQVDSVTMWVVVTCIGSPYDVSWQTFFQNLLNQAGAGDTSDPQNANQQAALALLSQWVASLSWTATQSASGSVVCPLCGPTTLCGASTIAC